MTSVPRLIVFDCDGTLVDSQHLIAEAMKHTFVSFDLAPPKRHEILRTVGLSVPEALAYLAPGETAYRLTAMGAAYREACLVLRQQKDMQEPMFKGAAELLFTLASREDVLLGLATGKSRRGVARFLELHCLHDVFITIQTADDAPSKPHPAMLLQALQETGAAPETAIMVGDTSYDMIMASCAGFAGVGVTWGYHSVSDLKRAGARTIVRSFAALAQALSTSEPATSCIEAA